MKTYIKGNFRRSIYSSDSGYTVGLFKVRETNDPELEDFVNKTVTFTGFFHDLNEETVYMLYGKMVNHDRYGWQFQVDEYDIVKPEGKEGLVMFLASDLFSGVGEKMATKIVDEIGLDALDKIKEDYMVLAKLKGVTIKKAKYIHDTLLQYEQSEKTIVTLGDLGFSIREALLIYKRYGSETLDLLDNNIYQLMGLIPFSKIDLMRENFNIEIDDKRRVKAAIIVAIDEICFKNGDTFVELIDIVYALNQKYGVFLEEMILESYLMELNSEYKIAIENDKYYLRNYYLAETNIAEVLSGKKKTSAKFDFEKAFEKLEIKNSIKYNTEQKKAIKTAIENDFTIITGGPGTGKTTIINAIVDIYQGIYEYDFETLISKVALVAPTGRAAKRMCESTLMNAMTIHRFLKWNKETDAFSINEFNKSEVDFVIIDEVSMIDTLLLNNLLLGLKRNVKIVMVGDYNQLPSVGPGQVLRDLISCNKFKVVELEHLYRQAEGSYISLLANDIKEGRADLEVSNDDFKFIPTNNNRVRDNVVAICKNALEKGYNFKDVQVLCPMYRGENGIDMLNIFLQRVFNPTSDDKKEYRSSGVIYRVGDKVLQLVNWPDENVFNGDVGVIKEIQNVDKKTEILIDYEGNIVKYYPKDLIHIKHAYAISIHKSQGSEFKIVIMPVVDSYRRMLYKKLVYTGITRAKRSLIIIGDESVFKNALKSDERRERRTTLKEMIINLKN